MGDDEVGSGSVAIELRVSALESALQAMTERVDAFSAPPDEMTALRALVADLEQPAFVGQRPEVEPDALRAEIAALRDEVETMRNAAREIGELRASVKALILIVSKTVARAA